MIFIKKIWSEGHVMTSVPYILFYIFKRLNWRASSSYCEYCEFDFRVQPKPLSKRVCVRYIFYRPNKYTYIICHVEVWGVGCYLKCYILIGIWDQGWKFLCLVFGYRYQLVADSLSCSFSVMLFQTNKYFWQLALLIVLLLNYK